MNVIFDISNIYYRSYFKAKKYLTHDEQENKAILVRKFFIDFCHICNMFINIDKVICCFDSRSYRKVLSVNYKQGREKKEQYFYDALDEIKYFLQINGFIVLKQDGLEADDLIFLCANLYEPNCVVSNDEDIRQYLNNNTCNLVLKKDDNKIYVADVDDFSYNFLNIPYQRTIIDPLDVTVKKILLGCKSDVVPKLAKRGVGERAIDKLLIHKNTFVEHGDLQFDKLLTLYNSSFNDRVTLEQIKHNLELITLTIGFDESMFVNQKYTYNKTFKMQEILDNTQYLKDNNDIDNQ